MRTFFIAGVFLIFYVMQLLLQDKALRHVDGDGSGYYAYLTAVFIYKSSDFSPVLEAEKKRHSLDYMAHYFHRCNDVYINKFYMGTALLILPFFLLSMLFSWIAGMPMDGYNIIFQYGVALAGAAWLAVGLLATKRLLLLFDIPKSAVVVSLVSILLGTNLFHYAFLQPSHSHVYSFAIIALFLLYARLYFTRLKLNYFALTAIFYGLVLLIRPSNGLVIFALPFVAGSKDLFVNGWLYAAKKPKRIIHWILAVTLIVMLQVIYNFSLTGKLFLWSYQNEGFNFGQPAIIQFLFSFRKGFFIYTPIMLLSMAGVIVLWRKNKWMAGSFVLFVLLLVYVLSSWWNWFYGDSFGMRPLVDFYAMFALPFAMLISLGLQKRLYSFVLFPVLFVLVLLNLFQTWQYQVGMIHPDAMDGSKYRLVFLRWGNEYRHIFGGNPEPLYSNRLGGQIASYSNNMEHSGHPWTSNGIQPFAESFSGNQVAQLNQSNIYSPTLVLQKGEFPVTNGEIYVKVGLQYRENETSAAQDALLVYAVSDLHQLVVFYKTFRIKPMPDTLVERWRRFETGFKVPAWDESTEEIKVYVWNKERKRFQLDDFEISFYTLDEQ